MQHQKLILQWLQQQPEKYRLRQKLIISKMQMTAVQEIVTIL